MKLAERARCYPIAFWCARCASCPRAARPVGDQFDGVDEVLSLGDQTAEALRFRQILDGNVMRGLLTVRFEFEDLAGRNQHGLATPR